MRRDVLLIAPYAVWMALMTLLPTAASGYALRGALTALALIACGILARRGGGLETTKFACGWLPGLLVGVIVFFVWIAPEPLVFKGVPSAESPYAPTSCGIALTLAKLAASALVIPIAEELFFRGWLVSFAGFGWMVALFAVEHYRGDLGVLSGLVFVAEGAFAGVAYGYLAKRYGLVYAILAHALTNLLLGVYVILFGKWFYW